MYYLHKYLKEICISSEACYELAMYLIDYAKVPLIGSWVRDKVVELFKVKVLLESPRLENMWIYKLIANYKLLNGQMAEAAKWMLIQQQVMYNTISYLDSQQKEIGNSISEDLGDMIYAILDLMEDREVFSFEDFQKAYLERRETRLLEKMYQLSKDENSEAHEK